MIIDFFRGGFKAWKILALITCASAVVAGIGLVLSMDKNYLEKTALATEMAETGCVTHLDTDSPSPPPICETQRGDWLPMLLLFGCPMSGMTLFLERICTSLYKEDKIRNRPDKSKKVAGHYNHNDYFDEDDNGDG